MIPPDIHRIEYASSRDGMEDWALARPPANEDTWIVMIHGHGSTGDQLYTRPDIRDRWLPCFQKYGFGILTPNLRGNAWMGPAAALDLHDLLGRIRHEYHARHFLFASGSMGGTSNLIYAALYPEDVAGVVALGAASDLATYHAWCRTQPLPILKEIADAIEDAYGGTPAEVQDLYFHHSPLRRIEYLTMPVYLAHGTDDVIIPIAESRTLAGKMTGNRNFTFHEIPGGNHDSPLNCMPQVLDWLTARL